MASINKVQLPNGEVYRISPSKELFIDVSGSSSLVTGSLSTEQLVILSDYLDNIKDIYIQLDATENNAFHNKVYFTTIDIITGNGNIGTFTSRCIDGNNLIKFSLQVNNETFENTWTVEIIDDYYAETTVVANPTTDTTNELKTITIGDVDYKIASDKIIALTTVFTSTAQSLSIEEAQLLTPGLSDLNTIKNVSFIIEGEEGDTKYGFLTNIEVLGSFVNLRLTYTSTFYKLIILADLSASSITGYILSNTPPTSLDLGDASINYDSENQKLNITSPKTVDISNGGNNHLSLETDGINIITPSTLQILSNDGTALTVSPESIYLMSNQDYGSVTVSTTRVSLYSEHEETGNCADIGLSDGNINFTADNVMRFYPTNGIEMSVGEGDETIVQYTQEEILFQTIGNITFSAKDNNLTFEDRGIVFKAADTKGLFFEVDDIDDEISRLVFDGSVSGGCFELNRCDGSGFIKSSKEELRLEHWDIDTETVHSIFADANGLHLSSDTKIDFNGNVDFSDATVTGLPSSGGSVDTSNLVTLSGEQTISGKKTFNNLIMEPATTGGDTYSVSTKVQDDYDANGGTAPGIMIIKNDWETSGFFKFPELEEEVKTLATQEWVNAQGFGSGDLNLKNGEGACSLEQSFEEDGTVKGSKAYGKYSTALNQNNEAYQRNSFVTGGGNKVGLTEDEFNNKYPSGTDDAGSTYAKSNSFANAGGQESTVTGRGSHIGGGYLNSVSGAYSGILAGGDNEVVSEYSGVLAGYGNTVSASKAIILNGYNNNVMGESAGAGGVNNSVSTSNSFAFGANLILNQINNRDWPDRFVAGRYNNENSYALFQVGTGWYNAETGVTNRRNSLEVYENGKTQVNLGLNVFEGANFNGIVSFSTTPTVNDHKVITAADFTYSGNVLTIDLT